jgi:hypothetical protein
VTRERIFSPIPEKIAYETTGRVLEPRAAQGFSRAVNHLSIARGQTGREPTGLDGASRG